MKIRRLMPILAISLQSCIFWFLEPNYETWNFRADPDFKNDSNFGLSDPADALTRMILTAEEIAAKIPAAHIEVVARPVGSILRGDPGATSYAVGAGVIIEYAERHWILSVAHLNNNDNVYRGVFAFFKDTQEWPQEIELVAVDKTLDFSLWQFKNKNYRYPHGGVKIGSSAALKVGSKVYAYGSPSGDAHTFTEGIVANLGIGLNYNFSQPQLITHDINIDHGNSGGPLLNEYGELVGINAMGRGHRTIRGLAVPIDDIAAVLRKIKKPGYVTHPEDGLGLINATNYHDLDFEKRGIRKPLQPGVMVAKVYSPAYEAGFRVGDVILCYAKMGKVNEPRNYNELKSFLKFHCEVGDEIEFQIDRYGQKLILKLTLR